MISFSIDSKNALLIFTLITALACGLIVYFRNKSGVINRVFFLLTLSIGFWVVSMIGYRGFQSYSAVITFARLLYVSAALIPLVFIYFARILFDESYILSKIEKYALPIGTVAMVAISLIPNLFILSAIKTSATEKIITYNQVLHIIYGIYIVGYFLITFSILAKKYKQSVGAEKRQIKNIILGTATAAIVGTTTNLFLLYFGIFTFNWFGQVGTLAMIIPIFYLIIRYELFNIKIAIAEILVFTLWFILFSRTFFPFNKTEIGISLFVLSLSIIIGILLIRSFKQEITNRNKIEKLVRELEELDEIKSEFASMATHQLSTPLTAIKGYVSFLQEERDLTKEEHGGIVSAIYRLVDNLTTMIRDFLDVSRLENKQTALNLDKIDIYELIDDVIYELKPKLDAKNIQVSLQKNSFGTIIARADGNKLVKAFKNIFDNSIKYTSNGKISVEITAAGEKIITKIEDTGVRVLPTIPSKLVKKFSQTGDENEAAIIGNGLGLYAAKQIFEAHGGILHVIIDKDNNGWQFIVELPQ